MRRDDIRFVELSHLLRPAASVFPVVLAALLLGACANTAKLGDTIAMADTSPGAKEDADSTKSELDRAIEYWGKKSEQSPRDLTAALNYAKNLRAAGRTEVALGVLQTASVFHGTDKRLAAEYGKLALEIGQVSLAQRLLEVADDPAKPDWKLVSARGTVFAKQGQYKQAIPFYERALGMSPNQPSVVSNLAMAYAADGDAPRAEAMLRKIAERPDADAKVRQNLALVLSLQGKHDEARAIATNAVSPEVATQNTDYLRQMVKAEPQAQKAAPVIGPGVWVTNISTGSIVPRPAAQPGGSSQSSGLKPSQR